MFKVQSFRCYREFFAQYLGAHGLSYRDFCEKTNSRVSPSVISSLLKKDQQQRFTKKSFVKDETWMDCLRSMDLAPDEIEYLMLLKMWNDSATRLGDDHPLAVLFKTQVHSRGRQFNLATQASENDTISGLALTIGRSVDSLPYRYSKAICEEVVRQIAYFQAMKRNRAKSLGLDQAKNHIMDSLN